MPKIKVTQKGVEALLRTPPARRVDYFDVAHPGLCLTIGPKSSTWYFFRRIDGKLTRLSLGNWPDVSILAAREACASIEATISAGKHPKAEQARARADLVEARKQDNERILANVAALWKQQHWPTISKSSQENYRKALNELVEAFGDQDIGTIRRQDLVRHLDRVRVRSNTAANRAAVVTRQLFAFTLDRFDLDNNVAGALKNPVKATRRKRVLDRDELRVLWKACDLVGYPYGHALQFAICTGQRIGEVGAIRRNDIDNSGDYWTQATNKSDQRIDIFIADHARAVLKSCPNFGKTAPFFSASAGTEGAARPLRTDIWASALRKYVTPKIAEAAKALGLDPIEKKWTPHDLRRSVRTALTGWCGVSPDTAERVLNHAIGGLRGVYDHADYRPHVSDALQRWNAELSRILRGQAPTLVAFDKKRARRIAADG